MLYFCRSENWLDLSQILLEKGLSPVLKAESSGKITYGFKKIKIKTAILSNKNFEMSFIWNVQAHL